MNREVIVSFENAGVNYGDFNVFKGVTMQVKEAEIVSVVGPNGSGKTTLVRTLLGFVPVAEGTVTVFGEPPSRLRRSGLAAYLPQEGGHDPTFPVTAYDVIAMGLLSHKGLSERLNSEERDRIFEAVRLLDIESIARKHFGSLSGGQKQRVLIARALARRPKLIVMDEPSTGLDVPAQNDFYALLKNIRAEFGVAVLLVSHDVGMVSSVVDRMLLLNRTIHYFVDPKEGVEPEVMEQIFGRNMRIIVHDGHCLGCGRTHD